MSLLETRFLVIESNPIFAMDLKEALHLACLCEVDHLPTLVPPIKGAYDAVFLTWTGDSGALPVSEDLGDATTQVVLVGSDAELPKPFVSLPRPFTQDMVAAVLRKVGNTVPRLSRE